MAKDLQLNSIRVRSFRRLRDANIKLKNLNVLVGSNNSGKSSFLQGVHFGVSVATAHRQAGKDTFTQDKLLFCPSGDFTELRHGLPYSNQSNFGYVNFSAKVQDTTAEHQVRIYRGRNEANVGCERSGSNPRLSTTISDPINPFTVYVPGLAGIPRQEEYRSESVIRRGVAGGDANLYLRNVLLLIKEKGKLPELVKRMQQVFPAFAIEVSFNPTTDVSIKVKVATLSSGGRMSAIDLSGTGVLQALQIFSYITLFEPSVLLLDEPDAHLHPNNQIVLAKALIAASNDFDTQIICSTHSRHLVDALKDEAQFVWLKDGIVNEQGESLTLLPLLLDLGAIDGFDKLRQGAVDWFVLSEDTDMSLLKVLFKQAGFDLARMEFRTYSTSSRMEAALELASYIKEVSPPIQVIIHRDRDFMLDEEAAQVSTKVSAQGVIPFVTRTCDVEGYFVDPRHVCALFSCELASASQWLDQIAQQNHIELQHSYTRKRDEIKHALYRGKPADAPDTAALLGSSVPLAPDKRVGKKMLKWCRALASQANPPVEMTSATNGLDVSDLILIRSRAPIVRP